MRLHWMMVGVLSLGCAGASRGLTGPSAEGRPAKETVYLVPLAEAMQVTRRIFEERRYGVFEQENGTVLFTSAFEAGKSPRGSRTFERFYVKGERLGPRQSLVRVFRLRYDEYTADDGGAAAHMDMSAREAETFAESALPQAHNLAVPGLGSAPSEQGFGYIKSPFQPPPFAGAPAMEGFKPARGHRELEMEGELLARLERVPALEIVGGAPPAPVRSLLVEEEDAASARTAECGEPLAGAEPLLTQGGTLLLADPLGTRELPTHALRLLCAASARGPVALGLSLPAAEQSLLEAYLASEGRPSDVQGLLMHGGFWRRDYQDGRGSHALLWLVEQARRLRASGRAVSLVAMDSNGASGNAREEEMARNVLAFREKHADAWLLVLAGGVHVRTGAVGWDRDFEPLGARLARALPSVKALDVGFTRGTQFACRYNVWEKVECNVFAISPTEEARQGEGVANGIHLFARPSLEGFHGRLYVGALTASPPALRAPAPAAPPPGASAK